MGKKQRRGAPQGKVRRPSASDFQTGKQIGTQVLQRYLEKSSQYSPMAASYFDSIRGKMGSEKWKEGMLGALDIWGGYFPGGPKSAEKFPYDLLESERFIAGARSSFDAFFTEKRRRDIWR